MNRFQKLAVTTAAATVLLFIVGGLVRGSGSGLGCSTWPECGPHHLLPFVNLHSLIEFSHRILVVIVTVLVAIQAYFAVRDLRSIPKVVAPAIAAVPLVLAQAVLGAIVVDTKLNPWWVTAHFLIGLAFVADVVTLAANAFCTVKLPLKGDSVKGSDPAFARLALITTATTALLLIVGTYVRAKDAGLAFNDWPLMDGKLVPALGGAATAMFLHRLLAAIAFVMVIYLAVRARTMPSRSKDLVVFTTLALGLFVAQILVGAANVWSGLGAPEIVGHVALAVLIWATLVALTTVSRRFAGHRTAIPIAEPEPPAERGPTKATLTAYWKLMKPRIIVLLLITTLPAMILARQGIPSLWLILATLAGGTAAAGAANAINMYLDRDIDEVMRRTRSRPLPAHRIHPRDALAFGFFLGALSFFFLAIAVNMLAASLALSAIAFYVFVYTMWLKRTTSQNIVIGGAAGAVPALVGWAAVTGSLAPPAWVLFAIVFLWTPPHFWALSMRYQGDYAAAGVPMLPVVRGELETRRQILLYSLVLFACSLLLVPVAHMGPVYTGVALLLGGAFVYRALILWREPAPARAWGLFKFSIIYLGSLFGAVAVDALIVR
jgi:heme o synthase